MQKNLSNENHQHAIRQQNESENYTSNFMIFNLEKSQQQCKLKEEQNGERDFNLR
jgi:hypothetical protein